MAALKRLCLITALAALFLIPTPSFACTACRDISAGSAPRARAGLRKGILVLGIPAAGIFLGILGLAWKMKPREKESESTEISDRQIR